MSKEKTNQLLEFIITENRTLYDILLDENVVGEENLELDFGITVGDKAEQQLKSKLLDKSSDIISKLLSYSYEIRENSIPLYSGSCSIESHTEEFELHLFYIDNCYISLIPNEFGVDEMKLYNDLDSCLKSCSTILSGHLESIEMEMSNYKENKDYYDDSESSGYGMSLYLDWNFPLPDYLFKKGIISKERLLGVGSIIKKL
jgi:hypothetical protein